MLSALLAATVIYLTWPGRAAILCERLPELVSLWLVGAAMFVLAARALAQPGGDRRIPGGAAILAALSFFLAARFVAEYRKPCAAVERQFAPPRR